MQQRLTILQGQIIKMTRGTSAIVETTDLLKGKLGKVDDFFRTNHFDHFSHRNAVPETTDFFLEQCGKGSQFFEDRLFG